MIIDSSIGNYEIGVSETGLLHISGLVSSDNEPVIKPPIATHYTILLDQVTNDLVIDSFGNIAICWQPYAVAQDVGSAIKLCLGELWYDVTKGVPFFQKIAGKPLPFVLLKKYIEDAAMTVPDVVQAVCTFDIMTNRNAIGQVLFTDKNGQIHGVKL